MKGKLIVALVFLCLVTMVAPTQAIYTRETCLNDTHINLWYNYSMIVNGVETAYTYNQTFHCTNNCSNNKCNDMTYDVDTRSMWLTFGVGISLLTLGTILGMPYGKLVGKEDIKEGVDTTVVVKYMFFFVGFYLVYLSLSMGRRVVSMYGGDANVLTSMSTATMVMTITLVLFLFIFVVEFIFTVLKQLIDAAAERKWGGREV